jgi:CheY-like chemotaxis protein
MARIRLIHWNTAEAQERAALLAALGYEVAADLPAGPELMRQARSAPPDAYVIDLSRLPSQGRDVALSLRSTAGSRRTPIVFVGGDPTKTERTRELLPDALFATWEYIAPALVRALHQPPAVVGKPLSVFAGYSGRPLPAKLGVKPGSVVALVNAPDGFAQTLGDLPDGVRLDGSPGDASLILCFVRSRRDLEQVIAEIAPLVQTSSLWLIWPKKASGVQTDVSEPVVRAAGLAVGLVDFKVAAVDATWSGLLFRRRKGTMPRV